MRRTLRHGLVGALALAALAVAHAQQRDATSLVNVANAIGTARVSGTVVSVDAQHQPIRGAIVTLTGPELPAGRSSITNDDGRFQIERLPPGRYALVATKPAYLTTAYGATRPGRPGVSLLITEGQQLSNLSLVMAHGAAITGIVTDLKGQPASGAQISVLRISRGGATLALSAESTAVTDDRGIYRVYGLAPGDYVVAAEPRGERVGGVTTMTSAEIDARFALLRQQRAGSVDPARPPASSSSLAAPPPRAYGVAPVFFPGVSAVAQAARITVGAGEERTGVDIALSFVPVASITGIVVAPDGSIPRVQFVVNQDLPETYSMSAFYNRPTVSAPGADGRFTLTNVTPGRYSIVVRTTAPAPARAGGPPVSASSATAPPVLFAAADVTVNGDDITGLTLALQPAMRLAGRIVFDQSTSATPPDLTKVVLSLTDVAYSSDSSSGGVRIAPAAIRADGTWEVTGLVPATYRMSTTLPGGSGWWLRSAIVGGKDVLDVGLTVQAGTDLTGAVLTVSDRHSSLSGTLQVPADQTPSSYFIVVYPSDRSMWRPQARRIQAVRPGTDGKFIAKDLPAGEYYLAALTDVEPDDLTDPAFFDTLIGASAKVTVAEGEQKTQDLRIGGRS